MLNTKDYGLPQSRPRVYIVGKKHKIVMWPDKCPMKNIKSFVDHTDKNRIQTSTKIENYLKLTPKNTFLNMEYMKLRSDQNPHYINCILKGSSIWCVPYHRWANVNELSRLQGIHIKNVVNVTNFKGQIGNSMSVNILVKLFKCNL